MMKNFTKILFTLATCMAATGLFANHLTGGLLFTARFSGDNEVPAVTTDGTGVGSFFLNDTRDTLCINITVNGLSGPITGAHIHDGVAGENGDVLINFTDDVDGFAIQATLTGDEITPEILEAMFREALYFNIHTASNPGGEVRSQIVLETDRAFHAVPNAAQETETIDSDATAIAIFNLSKKGDIVTYNVVMDGLTTPATMAHLHMAPAGQNGDVVVSLTDDIDGNVISGSFDPTEFEGLLQDMLDGNIYLNIHTATNPGGEIRGQLQFDAKLSHDAFLNVEQEMPAPTGSDAKGLAWASLNYTMDTLFYQGQFTGLTGEIQGAHFHEGTFGNNGDVLIGLTDDVEGNVLSGFVTGADVLTVENINKFLSGGIYINIHTEQNPAGEIRGQVYKAIREGYTLRLSGLNEVPAVTTEAYGSGIISIDRDQSNVHFMIAYNDLTAAQTMAHFHAGAAGTNGWVIFGLGSFFNQDDTFDSAFGYWADTDDTPFDDAAAMAFREGEVYVNVHTSENPGGELRGQVTRTLICSQAPLGIFETPQRKSLSIYPNPSSDFVNVDLSILPPAFYQVQIVDITGKVVRKTQVNSASANISRLDISDLNQGIYMVTILGDVTNYTARLIRE